MSNLLSVLEQLLQDYDDKLLGTIPCIIFSPVLSFLAIIYELY